MLSPLQHRVFWYLVHVAMEDVSVLRKGIVLLIYPQEARLDQFDHQLWRSISDSCMYSLPIQWRSTHIIHPNRFFSIIHPLFMSTLPQPVQDRVIVHSGTKMKVLANLLRYCLPWDRIPSDVGGCIDLDLGIWLSERMVKEEKAKDTSEAEQSSGIADVVNQLQRQCEQEKAPQQPVPINTNGQPIKPYNFAMGSAGMPILPRPDQDAVVASHPLKSATNPLFLNLAPAAATPAAATAAAAVKPSASQAADKSDKKSAKKKGKPAVKSKPATASDATIAKSGRKSDPRMDRAVEAKLADPSMSLLNALRAGGFDIPTADDGSSTPQYLVVDGHNVKITQRKNQLLRRLRTAKQG